MGVTSSSLFSIPLSNVGQADTASSVQTHEMNGTTVPAQNDSVGPMSNGDGLPPGVKIREMLDKGVTLEQIKDMAEKGVGPPGLLAAKGLTPERIVQMAKEMAPQPVQSNDETRAKITAEEIFKPELRDLKVIGVEEHFRANPQLMSKFGDGMMTQLRKQLAVSISPGAHNGFLKRFQGGPEQRVKDMDDNLIAVQLLSRAATVNAIPMDAVEGSKLTSELNDDLKKTVDAFPGRFAALCELPLQSSQLAKEELQRCVKILGFKGAMLHGTVAGKFLDAPEFDDLLSTFEELDCPLYLHPGIPPKAVSDAYYSFEGKPDLSLALMGPGWGWHQEVAVHILRLAVSGTLDKHPKLKLVIGHQGELLPMMMERFEHAFDPKQHGLKRGVAEMLRSQVWVAISGFFSIPTTQLTIAKWGTDRVLFANDYPFVGAETVPQFLKSLGDIVAPSDMKRICQTNAEELFKIKA